MGNITKYTVLLFSLLVMGLGGYAQNNRRATAYDTIPYAMNNMFDVPLLFQGKPVEEFTKWCLGQVHYPEEALANNITGSVYIRFIIDTAGVVSDIKVTKSAHPLLDNEAVRVISASPKWDPVTVKGKKVNVRFLFPVVFNMKKTRNDTSIVHARFNHKGHTNFMKWVAENIVYPKKAAKAGYTGTVAIAFDISEKGYVSNVRVISGAAAKGNSNNSSTGELASLLDAEAVRVVSSSPRWTPAMKDNLPVKASYNVTVVFQGE